MNLQNLPKAADVLSLEQRALVVNSLRQWPLFGNVGQRLLADLVEWCRVADESIVGSFQIDEIDPTKQATAPKIFEVEGLLGVFVFREGLFVTEKNGERTALFPGLHSRFDAALNKVPIGDLRLSAVEGKAAQALFIVRDALMASPELAWRVEDIPEGILSAEFLKAARVPTLVWVAGQTDAQIPVTPLMHVLAGAIAQQGRDVAMVELGGMVEVARWDADEKRFVPRPPLGQTLDAVHLEELIESQRGHVLVLNPKDPMRPPDPLKGVFHQIVYVTDQIPTSLPPSLRDVLRDDTFGSSDARHEEPYFVSFVPTAPTPRNKAPAGNKRRQFGTCKIPDGFEVPDKEPRATGLRPHRDACVVPVDGKLLRRTWDKWLGGAAANPRPFLDAAVEVGAISFESASRWARAVTMRRVGFALSGGGASAYRALPILERLKRAGVPVDVFAGLSGGALIGAFYCLKGTEGLTQLADLGPFIQLTMPLAMWSTYPLEAMVDRVLGSARVENLEVRLAAVTVALPADGSPRGEVVDTGTLGEAARVSGALPPAFAPTDKCGMRYTDGGACTVVPARVACDHGADVILACNAIPCPAQSNPFHGLPGGSWLRTLPPWDRLIDFDAWRSYMWRQTNRRFADDADAFIEFDGDTMSGFEPMLWIQAWQIVGRAKDKKQGQLIDKAIEKLKKAWDQLDGRTPQR